MTKTIEIDGYIISVECSDGGEPNMEAVARAWKAARFPPTLEIDLREKTE